MSSILDALNKLEQEKAQEAKRDIDPASAAKDLVGRDVFRDRMTLRVSPGVLVVGLFAFALILVAVSVAVSLIVLRPNDQSASVAESRALDPVAVAAVIPVEQPASAALEAASPAPSPEEIPVVVTLDEPEPVDIEDMPSVADTVVAAEEILAPEDGDVASDESGEVVDAPVSDAAPAEPAAEAPADPVEGIARAEIPIEAPSSAVRVAVREPEPVLPLEPGSLPLWTPSVEQRYRVDRIVVNMVAPQTLRQRMGKSYDYAVINKSKVQAGQRVPDTRVKLVQVEADGVVIQVDGSREYYYLPL